MIFYAYKLYTQQANFEADFIPEYLNPRELAAVKGENSWMDWRTNLWRLHPIGHF
jgi:hypothetical protein